MKLPLVSMNGEKASTISVAEAIFGATLNPSLLAQAVHVFRSNQRSAHPQAKTRGEVTGTTKKAFAQKHTGYARHGDKKAPIFVGGGKAHGPTGYENWKRRLSASMRRAALIAALSLKANDKQVLVAEDLTVIEPKTAPATKWLQGVFTTVPKRTTLVIEKTNENVLRAFRNVPGVSVTRADRLTAAEVFFGGEYIIDKPALDVLRQRLVAKEVA